MDELKNQLAQYLCSQIHNGTKDLIELIESEDLLMNSGIRTGRKR